MATIELTHIEIMQQATHAELYVAFLPFPNHICLKINGNDD